MLLHFTNCSISLDFITIKCNFGWKPPAAHTGADSQTRFSIKIVHHASIIPGDSLYLIDLSLALWSHYSFRLIRPDFGDISPSYSPTQLQYAYKGGCSVCLSVCVGCELQDHCGRSRSCLRAALPWTPGATLNLFSVVESDLQRETGRECLLERKC